ncbi:MAG: hypothetical protein MI807_17745 [Verrucomicrobiales bacterium]|nr:hypothetical protein [Verrucomicrobiales bacterium]
MKRIFLLLLLATAVLVTSCNQQNRYRYNRISPYGGYGESRNFDYGYGWKVKDGGARILYDY